MRIMNERKKIVKELLDVTDKEFTDEDSLPPRHLMRIRLSC